MSNMSNNNITDGTTEFRVIDKRLFSILDLLYPVGRIIISNDSKPPYSDIGFGTWQEVAKGAFIEGADDSHKAGDNIDAGLPNITGGAGCYYCWSPTGRTNTNGAFSWNDNGGGITQGGNNNTGSGVFWFDASRCSSVYGKSNTVQPKAYVSHYWLRVK